MSVFGTPTATDPISGEKRDRITIQGLAREGGWQAKSEWDGWVFTKNGRTLYVRTWEGSNSPTSAVLHESQNHAGMFIAPEDVKKVLFGERCLCDAEGKSGIITDWNPDCPFTHRDPLL